MRFSRWGAVEMIPRVSFRRHRTCDRMKPRRYVPCVDGSKLARVFLHARRLVGAAMCFGLFVRFA
jgi:hypothetical protein